MKYFVPAIFDSDESEKAYARVREHAIGSTQSSLSDRRVDSISFLDGEAAKSICVGEWRQGATVQCIFEGELNYVVCPARDGQLVEPTLIDREIVTKVVYFDGFGALKAA